MRSSFGADWAFGIRGAIENTIRRAFPSDLRRWPILHAFNFEAYEVGAAHFVMILRDTFCGITTGPGVPEPFPHNDHPPVPPAPENIDQWLSYLIRKFDLRIDDVAMILPIHDSGRSNAAADFEMFTDEERELWTHQLNMNIARQMSGLGVSSNSPTATPPVNITYNVSGANARVNINSSDQSVNVASHAPPELLREMVHALQMAAAESAARNDLVAAIEAMASAHNSTGFGHAYKEFMSVLADHIQVFGPILAPYLPALAALAI